MPARKLTPEMVAECRKRYKAGESLRDLAREFGIHASTLSAALRKGTPRDTSKAVAASATARRRRSLDTLEDGKQWCSRCAQILPLTSFAGPFVSEHGTGYSRWCKPCRAAYQRARKSALREMRQAATRYRPQARTELMCCGGWRDPASGWSQHERSCWAQKLGTRPRTDWVNGC
jgi:transposase-like protein